MATTSRLALLPHELFEKILEHSDLAAIKKLRSTCKSFGERCVGPRFKEYYAKQKTDLSPISLARLVQIASHPIFGQAIKHLAITTVFYDVSLVNERLRHKFDTQKDFRLVSVELQWLLGNRQQVRDHYIDTIIDSLADVLNFLDPLDEISLAGRVVRARDEARFLPLVEACPSMNPIVSTVDFREFWSMTARAFRIVTSAMDKSTIKVGTLSIYDSTDQCSMSSHIITSQVLHLAASKFPTAAGLHIENLALSFSTRVKTQLSFGFHASTGRVITNTEDRHFQASDAMVRDEENFTGVAAFLKLMPNLKTLDLHLYNTLKGAPWPYDRVFNIIADEVKLPSLQRLTLRGMRALEEQMLLFLRNHPTITHLDLREVRITGSWTPILKHLSTSMPHLCHLHLSSISTGRDNMLNLTPKNAVFDDGKRGKGYSFPAAAGVFRHTRDIGVDELKSEKGLVFEQLSTKKRKGSKLMMDWVVSRRKEYGPPF